MPPKPCSTGTPRSRPWRLRKISFLGVVIPKIEQLQKQGAVGQRKINQYTRYLTIAIAVLQSTGLVFLFHNGGGSLVGNGQNQLDLVPNFTVPRVLLIVASSRFASAIPS